MIRHATASAFVFRRFADGWRLGLVEHPVFDRNTVVGGHVEEGETPEEAAAREALEESGYQVRILASCGITEFSVARDNQLDQPHVHVDHHFLAVTDGAPVQQAEHPFGWFTVDELDSLQMFDDSRELARSLLPNLETLGLDAAPSATNPAYGRRRPTPTEAPPRRLRRKRRVRRRRRRR